LNFADFGYNGKIFDGNWIIQGLGEWWKKLNEPIMIVGTIDCLFERGNRARL